MGNNNKRVVAVLSDLMFTVKIQEAAKRAGMDAVFVNSKQDAVEQAKLDPAVIVLDLNNASTDALDVIRELKGIDETRKVPLLGYVSHVEAALRHAAQQTGCDTVLPRSAFSKNLPAILKKYTEG